MKTPLDHKAFNRTLLSALAVPLVLVVALFIGFFWQLSTILTVNHWVNHTDQVINQIRLVRNIMLNMETGLRGFLLTDSVEFLEPYRMAKENLQSELNRLNTLVADNPPQAAKVNQMKAQFDQWQVYSEDVLMRQAQEQPITLETHRLGDATMRNIRGIVTMFIEDETVLRNERTANLDRTVQTVMFVGTLGVILLGLLLAVLTRQQLRQLSHLYANSIEQMKQKAVALEHTLMDNKRLLDEEAKARKTAEEANAMKIYFLGMVSHELRTPLASIKGFATTLLADDVQWDAASQREFIGIISEEADKLTDLIGQLLDLSRLQAGRLRIETKPTTLAEIVTQAQGQFLALTANHHLRIESMDDLPVVIADPSRVAQVLTNLVSNAVKYSPAGGHIRLSALVKNGMVEVCVRDQGPGVPEAARQLIFEAFRQLEDKNMVKGAGLGLAICKGIIEMHGGKIWVTGDTEPGALFCFTLPILPGDDHAHRSISGLLRARQPA
jgi:signal transduction histidine kinase